MIRRIGSGPRGRRLDCPARGTAARRARGRYQKDGRISAHPPSNIPFLALGAWVLAVGWFGFNVMSAQTVDKISGLVAINSLMAMAGGTLAAWWAGRNDPGFAYNGPLAGLVAVCAGSDLMHPLGALVTGAVAGVCLCICSRWRRTNGISMMSSRLAAAWAVRRLGRHCGRHLWFPCTRRHRRCFARCATDRHPARHRDCRGRRHHCLRHAQETGGHPPGCRSRIQRGRPDAASYLGHARARNQLVNLPREQAHAGLFLTFFA